MFTQLKDSLYIIVQIIISCIHERSPFLNVMGIRPPRFEMDAVCDIESTHLQPFCLWISRRCLLPDTWSLLLISILKARSGHLILPPDVKEMLNSSEYMSLWVGKICQGVDQCLTKVGQRILIDLKKGVCVNIMHYTKCSSWSSIHLSHD